MSMVEAFGIIVGIVTIIGLFVGLVSLGMA